ncbi:MAG TPA: low-specificity L-threonine aldolase [Kofleriaceae bacterium]|nr:low-specificity L-threonine aldolase [Kofleriaceae bacterium]
MIDLLSDTVTLPTPEMRAAIASATLGDDVYGEDPTVARLEALAAAMLGKPAALLMPSGTMANLAAVLCHCPRGAEVLVGDETDLYNYEAGGASVVGGVALHPIPTQPDGRLELGDLAAAIRDPDDDQCATARLLCLENTHNRCGGAVLPLGYLGEVQRFAAARGLAVHIDGARLFNAACALDVPAAQLAGYADSVQFCLSKGLAAPIGSMLVGGERFIRSARRVRKLLGGGMRQAGIIAAAGIVALEQMVGRLVEDHAHARQLAAGLAELPGLALDPARVQTNIVMFRVTDARFTWPTFLASLRRRGVRMGELGHGRIRAVTHLGITASEIDQVIAAVADVLRAGPDPA